MEHSSHLTRLARQLLDARFQRNAGLVPFINCGDPDLVTTRALLSICNHSQVCAIELGVPFADSVTDGPTILKSHERALSQKITFDHVLELVRDFRLESKLPLYLIVEYSYTVRRHGIESVVARAKSAGVDGILLHCLPPVLTAQYLDITRSYRLATVLGLFPNSKPEKIDFVLSQATGFVYIAASYGRTGGKAGLSPEALSFFKTIRFRTDQPLAAGFGIKTRKDLEIIHYHGINAGIIGSPIARIIEHNLGDNEALCCEVEHYFKQMQITSIE